jgi:cytochrome c553
MLKPNSATARLRVFTSRCARGALLAIAALAVTPHAFAQSSGDAVVGKLLYEDTPNQATSQQLNAACANCHTVDSRRARIEPNQAPFGLISLATAQGRLQSAINSNVGGMGQFSVLTTQEVRDLAAYIADSPAASATQLDFAPSAVNVSQSLPLDLRHAAAPAGTFGNVRVASVAISGTNASDFSITSDACSLQTLTANGTCRVTVRFVSATTAGKTARLTFTLDPSTSTSNFTREVTLNGAVTVAAPPPAPPSSGGGDSGGGALGAGWLAALAAAVVATRRATRRPR